MDHIPSLAFLVSIVAIISVFSFVSVASRADARRKEREAYYKSETLKKIAEMQAGGGAAALEFLHEEEKIAARRAREGQKLGGLITAAVGLGLLLFFGAIADKNDKGIFLLGAIPFLIGVALLTYAYLLAPKE